LTALVLYVLGLALIAGAAWAVALPLLEPRARSYAPLTPPTDEKLRKRKEDAIAALREVEFDFRLGKLSEADYQNARAQLESDAVRAITALERDAKEARER
jgi:hypothetical protein